MTQFSFIKNSKKNLIEVRSGVPQGSILGYMLIMYYEMTQFSLIKAPTYLIEVKSGVPPGSILDFILFMLYKMTQFSFRK